MSIKAMNAVWDLEVPTVINGVNIKAGHKFVLLAYADHADHEGKGIWPAIRTISKKCGVDDRTVQRLTYALEDSGILVEDGTGPRGTNKWRMAMQGDKLSPLAKRHPDKSGKSLGDNPSGDNPSGDKLTPESNEPETNINDKYQVIEDLHTLLLTCLPSMRSWHGLKARLEDDDVSVVRRGNEILIGNLGRDAAAFEARYDPYLENQSHVTKICVRWLEEHPIEA